MRKAARAAICVVAVLASYGWLDLLRRLPGPHLPLVLPLRANGNGDDVSLVAVILVVTATFAAIARIAPPRPRVAGRLAILRGALLAAFLITAVALQQGIVEQSRPTFDWSGSLSLAWPWLAATCAVLGTLLGAPAGEQVATPEPQPELMAPRAAERIDTRELEATVA